MLLFGEPVQCSPVTNLISVSQGDGLLVEVNGACEICTNLLTASASIGTEHVQGSRQPVPESAVHLWGRSGSGHCSPCASAEARR